MLNKNLTNTGFDLVEFRQCSQYIASDEVKSPALFSKPDMMLKQLHLT